LRLFLLSYCFPLWGLATCLAVLLRESFFLISSSIAVSCFLCVAVYRHNPYGYWVCGLRFVALRSVAGYLGATAFSALRVLLCGCLRIGTALLIALWGALSIAGVRHTWRFIFGLSAAFCALSLRELLRRSASPLRRGVRRQRQFSGWVSGRFSFATVLFSSIGTVLYCACAVSL